MAIKRCGGAYGIETVSGTSKIFQFRVPLRLRENQIALAKHIKLSMVPTGISEAVTYRMYCSANPDEELVSSDIDFDNEILRKPAVFYHDTGKLTEAVDNLGGAVLDKGNDLPLYGFPLVGDFSVFGLINHNGSSASIYLSLYYDEVTVSQEEWLKYAKRQRNAPRDTMPISVFNT